MQHQETQLGSEEFLPTSFAQYQIWIQNLGAITIILNIWPESYHVHDTLLAGYWLKT